MARKEKAMKFYHTEGEPKYMVGLYYWNGNDQHYFDTYGDALAYFRKVERDYADAGKPHEAVSMSLYDIKKDVRKMYCRIEAEA